MKICGKTFGKFSGIGGIENGMNEWIEKQEKKERFPNTFH